MQSSKTTQRANTSGLKEYFLTSKVFSQIKNQKTSKNWDTCRILKDTFKKIQSMLSSRKIASF